MQVPEALSSVDVGMAYIPNTAKLGPQPGLKTVGMLACGLPVIATDTNGNRLFIQDRFNGMLVPDNSESLEQAINTLLEDSSLRQEFSSNAHDSIREYDFRRIVDEIVIPTYNNYLQTKR